MRIDRRVVGAMIDVTQFVGAHVVDVGGGRIKTRTVVSDDGALAPGRPFDSELGVPCIGS